MNNYIIKVSDHAFNRIKERSGINKKAAQRLAERAYHNGIKHNEVTGSLHKFISGICKKSKTSGTDIRIYGDKAFLFSIKGKFAEELISKDGEKIITLITILQVPNYLIKNVNGAMNKKRDKGVYFNG